MNNIPEHILRIYGGPIPEEPTKKFKLFPYIMIAVVIVVGIYLMSDGRGGEKVADENKK